MSKFALWPNHPTHPLSLPDFRSGSLSRIELSYVSCRPSFMMPDMMSLTDSLSARACGPSVMPALSSMPVILWCGRTPAPLATCSRSLHTSHRWTSLQCGSGLLRGSLKRDDWICPLLWRLAARDLRCCVSAAGLAERLKSSASRDGAPSAPGAWPLTAWRHIRVPSTQCNGQ